MGLTQYVVRRTLLAIPVLFGITLICFLLMHLAPGDPIYMLVSPRMQKDPEVLQAIRAKYGLDKPIYIQYFIWLKRLLTGHLGKSIFTHQPISTMLAQRWPNSFRLAAAGLFLSYLLSIPLGILAAVHRGEITDFLAMLAALIGLAIPNFWLALMLMLIFSVRLGWFPISGYGTIQALILPAVTYGVSSAGSTTRLLRTSMLEVFNKDFIRTARAKGLKERIVLYKHAFRNALLPLITGLGMTFSWLLSGAVVLEVVFARPGLGRLVVNSIYRKDYPVIQIMILIFGIGIVFGNLIADILYAVTDPRIRYD